MKKILLLGTLFISTAVFACPNLAGSYRCVDTDSEGNTSTSDITIAQNGNIFSYRDGESTMDLVADGSVVAIEGGVMRTSCSARELIIELNAEQTSDDGYRYHLASYTTVAKSGANLITNTTSEITFNGELYRDNESSHCTQL